MSSAFYPLAMNKYNNRKNPHNYESWKGTGTQRNPVGTTRGNIRPLTNNDLTNATPYKCGKARPMKWQYRKGSCAQANLPITILDPCCPDFDVFICANRQSNNGRTQGLVSQLIDQPGGYSIRDNVVPLGPQPEDPSSTCRTCSIQGNIASACPTCNGIPVVSNYQPTANLTQNPMPKSQTPGLCCNEQRKALRRVRPASTNLSKRYYTTTKGYLQNRCQTYEQRAFNFVTSGKPLANPGTPQALSNTYVANCYPTTCQSKDCSQVIYKPSNPQFATEGGVSSSARTFKLAVTSVEKNKYYNNLYKGHGNKYETIDGKPNTPFIYKDKSQPCEPLNARTYWHKPKGGVGTPLSCNIQSVPETNQSRGAHLAQDQ